MDSTQAEFRTPETFRGTFGFAAYLSRYVPMLVVFLGVTLLLLQLLLAATPLRWPVSLAVIGVFGATLITMTWYQFHHSWGRVELRLAPDGVTLTGPHHTVQLPWEQIRRLGRADLIAPYDPVTAGPIAAKALLRLTYRATRRPGRPALVGVGRTTIRPGTPRPIRVQVARSNGCREFDAASLGRLTAVVLTGFDERDRQGRIMAWVRAYRPDLVRP